MGKRLIVMRGVQGSGKTTFAKSAFKGAPRFSADDFFSWLSDKGTSRHDPRYLFDPAKLPEAHAMCLRNATRALMSIFSERAVVIIDNTHTKVWQFAPYVALGLAYDWDVRIVHMRVASADLRACAERNVHNV